MPGSAVRRGQPSTGGLAGRPFGRYRLPMATRKEILEIGGREVSISNPDKVYFPEPGLHEDGPRLVLPRGRRRRAPRGRRPADGAQALRRRDHEGAVLPEAGAGQHARLDPDRRADLPVRADRRRDRPRRARRARLGGQPRLHRPQPAPGPGRGPRPSRRAAGRPRPGAGHRVAADPRRRARLPRGARGRRASSAGRRPRARAGSTSTSGSSRAGRTPRSAARRWRWPATWRRARRRSRRASGGRRSATASSSTTTRTPRTGPWRRRTRSGRCPTPGCRCRSAGTRSPTSSPRTSRSRRSRRSSRSAAMRRPGSTRPAGSLDALLELSARHEAEGQGDAPVAAELRQAGRRAAARPAVAGAPAEGRVRAGPRASRADRRPRSLPSGRPRSRPGIPNAGLPTEWPREPPRGTPGGSRPTPDRPAQDVDPGHRDQPGRVEGGGARRVSSAGRPAIRRPAAHLEPADVLADGMRGRSSLWYRVRVNLIHVPEADRPGQEALDPGLRPVGRLRVARSGGAARAGAATAGLGRHEEASG